MTEDEIAELRRRARQERLAAAASPEKGAAELVALADSYERLADAYERLHGLRRSAQPASTRGV